MEMPEIFDLYEIHSGFEHENLVMYKGPFGYNALAIFQGYISGVLSENYYLNRKILSIFVELAQNIVIYSSEKVFINSKMVGVGVLAIGEDNDSFYFITGNLVSKDTLDRYIERIETINQLDKLELRELKRNYLNQDQGNNDTANIGLIQVALSSENKLIVKQKYVDDDNTFVTLKVIVKKSLRTAS